MTLRNASDVTNRGARRGRIGQSSPALSRVLGILRAARATWLGTLGTLARSGTWALLATIAVSGCGGEPQAIVVERERLDASIAFFERRLADHPDDVLTPAALADKYLTRFGIVRDFPDVARAERVLRDGLRLRPGHAPFLSRLVAVHIARHEFPEALETATAAYRAAPRRAANGRLFDAYFEAGEYDSAAAALGRMDPHAFGFLIRKARFADAIGYPGVAAHALARACQPSRIREVSLRAWCAVRRADAALTMGRVREAGRLFRQALDGVSDDPAAHAGLAVLAEARGDLGAARRHFTIAAGQPGGTGALLDLARLAADRGDAHAARRFRERFETLATDPAAGRAYWALLARTYAETGRAREALDLARRDLAQRPGPEAYRTLAEVLARLGRTGEACAAAERALSWTPRDAELLALRDALTRAAS